MVRTKNTEGKRAKQQLAEVRKRLAMATGAIQKRGLGAYTNRDYMFSQADLARRVNLNDTIPLKVQLAVASDSGRIDRHSMQPIRKRETKLQSKLNKEIQDVKAAFATKDQEQIQKQTRDLTHVFGKIGMNSYIYNFPNNRTLKLGLGKNYRVVGGNKALYKEHMHSKFLEKELRLRQRAENAATRLKSFNPNKPRVYRGFGGGEVAETKQMLTDRVASHNEMLQRAMERRIARNPAGFVLPEKSKSIRKNKGAQKKAVRVEHAGAYVKAQAKPRKQNAYAQALAFAPARETRNRKK